MTILWQLLKAYVRDFEIANQCEFSDEAWQRIKKLEADIEAEYGRRERELRDITMGYKTEDSHHE